MIFMNVDELLKEKENLMIRFLKLTEEALVRLEKEEEENLPQVMEKRESIIEMMKEVEEQLKGEIFPSKEKELKIQELKARLLSENQFLQEKMKEKYKGLQQNMGNNKKAIKISKAYQGSQIGYSLHLNKKN